MLRSIEEANKLNLAMKEESKLKEKEQDEAIFKYVQQKQQREVER